MAHLKRPRQRVIAGRNCCSIIRTPRALGAIVDRIMEVRMTRPKTRRSLRLETLESRSLLSSGGPNAQQQYMLELINMARTNPAEMASWLKTNLNANDMATIAHYGVNLDQALEEIAGTAPVQPLAWNATL